MQLIGHSEFGLDYKMIHPSNLIYPNGNEFNHWLEQWYLTYKTILELSPNHKTIYFIRYESLCDNPKVWRNIKDLLDFENETNFVFKNAVKTVDEVFDSNLSNKCNRLYDSLTKKSFGI